MHRLITFDIAPLSHTHITFGESHTHLSTFFKNLSNIGFELSSYFVLILVADLHFVCWVGKVGVWEQWLFPFIWLGKIPGLHNTFFNLGGKKDIMISYFPVRCTKQHDGKCEYLFREINQQFYHPHYHSPLFS